MIRAAWRGVRPLLPRSKFRAVVLVVESFVAGLLEASLLVLVVSAALAVNDNAAVGLRVPLMGTHQLKPGPALLVAALAGVMVLAIHFHTARLTAYFSSTVLRTARDRVIESFAAATWSRQAREAEGALQESVGTLANQTANVVMWLSLLASSSLGLAALLLVAVVVDPLVTLSVLVIGAVLFVAMRPITKLTRRRSHEFVRSNSALNEQITQWSGLVMELRVFGVGQLEASRLSRQNAATAAAFARTRFLNRLSGDLYKDVAILFLVGAVAALNASSTVDLAAVGAVVILVVRCLSYAQRTSSCIQQIGELEPNLESITRRINSLRAESESHGSEPLSAITRVEMADVGYDYEPGRPGVDGVTVDIVGGEAIGVIGSSGAGKSTIAQLLLRLRLPTRGTITVSGIPYEAIEPASWHRLVAFVSQEPKLFQGTVLDNIAFHRPGITREQVERAAAEAHVAQDINELPKGFETELGPRGAGLSGGQKQRVAIARALVGKPQLLILDEPTSSLDMRSEQLLQRTIEDLKGSVTLVIIAHRMTTLACCDRVIGMEDGRVRVIGTLSEARAMISFDDAFITGADMTESAITDSAITDAMADLDANA